MRSPPTPGPRRALLVDPDVSATSRLFEALRGSGLEPTAVADAETGLKKLAMLEPHILVLELEFAGRDGLWLLRRLRDEFMGSRPRVVVTTRAEAIVGRVGDLGVDAVILKPVSPAALSAACAAATGTPEAFRAAEVLGELVKLSFLEGELEATFAAVARRLALTFRVSECVIVSTFGERQVMGCARGPIDPSPDAPVWDYCRVALDAGAPVLAPFEGSTALQVGTYLAVAIESAGGTRLGVILLRDDGPRLFPPEVLDSLRALGTRLYGELAWRAVHERIAADRDRLRESSMLDPMLGCWTRGALDAALPAEVSAAQRRGETMCVAVVNLRGLRSLNEHHGHVVGDAALRHMAALTRATLRTQDIVARYEGDSIVLVLGGAPLPDARHVMERLADVIESTPLVAEEEIVPISVVIGLAQLVGEDDTGDAAIARAAWAMNKAKRQNERLLVAEALTPEENAEVSAAASSGLEAGATLGGMYQILHEISRGAMGVVYRAEDLGLGRQVALKTLRPDLARDRNFVERFRAEAATLASLRHENLVQVFAFGQDREDVFFVMELVEGEPLEDRVEMTRHDGRYMPLERVERVMRQVGDALDTMHKAGILHRDVKPANILFDRIRDRAVLVDVGIAKRRGTEHDPAGTPGYTAPETFIGGTEGPASDVYGLAATAYTLLTTALPFGEGGTDQVLALQQQRAPIAPSHWRPGLPPEVDAVLLRSLDPDARLRPTSVGAFAAALGNALAKASPEVRSGQDGGGGRRVSQQHEAQVHAQTNPRPPAPRISPPFASQLPDLPVDGGIPGAPAAELPPESLIDAIIPARPAALTRILPSTGNSGPKALSRSIAPGTPALGIPALREPDAPDAATPHTRGVLFRSAYRVLGARQGAAWVANVSRKNPALAQALQPQNTLLSWHPTEVFVEMLHHIAASGRDARAFGLELGRVAVSVTFGRFFGADPTALTPGQVFSATDLFWRRYHTWGAVAVDHHGEFAADVLITAGPHAPLVCAATSGILERVAILAGAASSEVAHPACEAAGADACVFKVTWRPTPPAARPA